MAPNPRVDTPSIDRVAPAHFQGRQRRLEMSDLYFKPTRSLVATPYRDTDSDPMESSLDSPLESSPTKRKRESFRTESTLVSRIETQQVHERPVSPESNSNGFSRLIFSWISGLLWAGYRQPLESTDIPSIHPRRRAQALTATVRDALQANHQRGDRSALFWALYGVFKREFWIGGLCRGVADVLLVTLPYTLRYLIQFAMDSYQANLAHKDGPPMWHGVAYLAGIVTMLAIQTLAHNHYMYVLGVIGGQSRAVLTSAIFDKSMRVIGRGRAGAEEKKKPAGQDPAKKKKKSRSCQKKAKDDLSTGHLTGLLSVDCARIAQAASGVHLLWTAPLSILIAVSLLVVNLRLSALAGLGLLVIGFACLIGAVGVMFRQRKAIDKTTETRVSLTQELLDAVRLVKYFGWEGGFVRRFKTLRSQETRKLHGYTAVRNGVGAVSQGLPVLTAMISFITYASTNSGLSPAIVFSSTALFTSLRMPLIYLPICMQGCIDSVGSLLRIQEYLLTEEMKEHPLQPDLDAAVEIRRATFIWDSTEPSKMVAAHEGPETISLPSDEVRTGKGFLLQDVDLKIRRGELLAVMGTVGSGKTSFLSALAGDMAKVSGSVVWGASHAVCQQQPWMWNATVRENICAGRQFDGSWYYTVLQATSLTRDLDILPHGDQTVVGERGVVLSGGQKQRISLARAMYSDKDVVLLDDPLSAVDANVGRAILDNAICGQMAAKTRVLCTHDMNLLHRCDRILWMNQGQVRALDTYQNLIENEPEFASLVQEPEGGMAEDQSTTKGGTKMRQDETDGGEMDRQDSEDSLIQDEDRATRSVSWKVYGSMFTSSNSILLTILCFPMLILGSGSMVMTQLWLAWWSSTRFPIERNTYIGIYVGLACAQVLFLYLFGLLLGLCCTGSSQVMLNKATVRILRAPIWFFDTTPLGRHMNRFSSDVEAMDYHLAEAMRMFCISICGLAAIFGLIIAYFHWFAIAVGTLLLVLVLLALYYRATARELKRHESVLRSVVFAHFVEGLSGVSTLRTYGMHSTFSLKLCDAVDDMNGASFATIAVQRWLSLRQDAATILLVLTMGILVIVERQSKNPAISGLMLSLMLGAVQVIQVVVREWADVENAMNSTERLHAYANSLPQEKDDACSPPARDWPQAGQVQFNHARMRYRPDLPEALKGVNLHIHGGEHIAIVGRTGAGKSSIINGLFRLTDVSGGSIAIDGSDVSRIPLQDLRSSALSIIPQEATFFSGTIRSNLDPFDDYTDEQIWTALRTAGLQHTMHASDIIHDQGANLSLGQRQLLALARVLMRDTRILVCDEATAALDTATDDHIQRTMRRAFRDRTVICIAHRLRTVLWYDRICVMDAGQVAELGSPLKLFRTEGGIFRQMCMQLGITERQIVSAMRMTRVRDAALELEVHDDKAPQLEMSFPSPEIAWGMPSPEMRGREVDALPDALPELGTVKRMRARRSWAVARRGRRDKDFRSGARSSWMMWEETTMDRERIIR